MMKEKNIIDLLIFKEKVPNKKLEKQRNYGRMNMYNCAILKIALISVSAIFYRHSL